MGKKNKSSSNHIQCIIPLCTAGLNNTHIGHRRGRTHPRLLLQISVIFSHCSQVTHSAPEITTRKEKKKEPTSGKPAECPFHLWETHPSLSHPCSLLFSSKPPFPPLWIRSETRPERRQLWNLLLFHELVSSSLHLPGLESTRIRGAGLFLRLLLQSSTGALWVNLPRAARWLAEPPWCWGRRLVAVQPAAVLEH